MPRPAARSAPLPPAPTPAVRVVFGMVFQCARPPQGIATPVTAALQKIARDARSQIAAQWAVFPAYGTDLAVVGFSSARTPQTNDSPWSIEPGAPAALRHHVTSYACWEGASVGRQRDDRTDADCFEDFARALSGAPAWADLGAAPRDVRTLPGGAHVEWNGPEFLLLSDDGRGADVVRGMSFWRAGDTYTAGRVRTWTRPLDDGDSVRVVGVARARVDATAPLCVAPARNGPDADTWTDDADRETRAALDSTRPFGWYFIADAP